MVEESSATATARPGEANAAAVPLPASELVHEALVYSLTVEPASAEPLTLGALLFAGEEGATASALGAAGAGAAST